MGASYLPLMQHRLPVMTLALAGLAVVLFATLGRAPSALVFDRAAITDGEWWRLLSGHWVHSDRGHLGWNTGALILLGSIVEMHNRRALSAGLIIGSLGVSLMIWLGLSNMTHYCGLSGVLNTLLLSALYALWRQARSPGPIIIGALSLLKILVESTSGAALFTHAVWASVPLAHLAGWITGLVLIAVGTMPNRAHN